MLTPSRLREILSYDPETGEFRWNVRVANVRAGTKAGSQNKTTKYVEIGISGKLYTAHRLAFMWMTGSMPVADVDHANGQKDDNRWSNLREATRAQNNMNTNPPRNNTSGVKGVHWCKITNRWRAVISINNRPKHLGRFDTKEDAAAAYSAAAVAMHGEFARTS